VPWQLQTPLGMLLVSPSHYHLLQAPYHLYLRLKRLASAVGAKNQKPLDGFGPPILVEAIVDAERQAQQAAGVVRLPHQVAERVPRAIGVERRLQGQLLVYRRMALPIHLKPVDATMWTADH